MPIIAKGLTIVNPFMVVDYTVICEIERNMTENTTNPKTPMATDSQN